MISIFDNMTAMLIGGVVLLILVTVQQRSSELGVEQTAIYVAKQQSLEFAEWLEDDINKLGMNFDSTAVRFALPVQSGGNTTSFEFYQDSLNIAVTPIDTVRIETRYQLNAASTATIADSTVQLYQLVRETRVENGFGGWTSWAEDGRSPGLLTYFEIELLNLSGQVVAVENQTSFVRMAFSLAPPFQSNKQYLTQLSWGTTVSLRPY